MFEPFFDNYRWEFDRYMETRMYEQRRNTLEKLSTVVGNNHVEIFANLINAARDTDLPEIEIFINLMELDNSDLLCLKEDFKGYKDFIVERERQELEFYHG